MSIESPIPETQKSLASRAYFYAEFNGGRAKEVLLKSPTDSHKFYVISEREFDVLQLLFDGCSNKEMALRLDISNQTVKNHITSLSSRLAVIKNGRTDNPTRTKIISRLVIDGIIEFRPRIDELNTPIVLAMNNKIRTQGKAEKS